MKIGVPFLFLALQLSCSNNEQQPNFVFILVDDLGWADVKCNYQESFYGGVNHDVNDGISLLPLLMEGKRLERDELFWHFPHYHGSGWKPGSAIRKGNWKLVVHYEDRKVELFNLATDPGEKMDVSEQFPEKVNELKAVLNKKLDESGGKHPEYNPHYLEKKKS